MDVLYTSRKPNLSASPSLRVRTTSLTATNNEFSVFSEIQLCPSVMSEDTKKMLPPTTETILTKPFPIRGKNSVKFDEIFSFVFYFIITSITKWILLYECNWNKQKIALRKS